MKYVKLNEKEKSVIRENKIELKKIALEIKRLQDNNLDTSGFICKDLNNKTYLLRLENADIRKGFKSISEKDPITNFMNNALYK